MFPIYSFLSLVRIQYFGTVIPSYTGLSLTISAFAKILVVPSREYPRCSRDIAIGIIPDSKNLEYITTIPFDLRIKLQTFKNFPEYLPKCSSSGSRAFLYLSVYFNSIGSSLFVLLKKL